MQTSSSFLIDLRNLSHAKALRRARELLKLTRNELALRLDVSSKTIQKYESGRANIDEHKLEKILKAMDLSLEEFQKIRKGKSILAGRKKKIVFENADRRSYRKVITKEVRVIKILRQMKNLTQDQASAICGYSRPSIGHIENGRIELDNSRVRHIIFSYDHDMSEFDRLMTEEVLRDEVMTEALHKMMSLPEDKLKLVSSLIQSI